MAAIVDGSIVPGTVLVIRYEGPKGGPGMREMLAITGRAQGHRPRSRLRPRHRRAILRRRRGGSASATSLPRRPTADRSPSCADGDRIRIDVPSKSLDLLVDDAELAARRQGWTPNPPRYTTGVLGKYAKLVNGAETGAVTN